MHECNKLDEKDLQCITRTLQGAIFEDSLYYGCKYCQYSKECSERLHNEEGLYFDMVRKKLQGITGLYMGVCYDPANPDATFTKGTEKKNTQKKWTSAVVWENRAEVKRDKDKICILESLLSPIYAYLGYALLRCTRLLSEFLFACNQRWNWEYSSAGSCVL